MSNNQANKLPTLIVTGASGFVGSSFIQALVNKYYIYAIAQRSREDCKINNHTNLQWLQCNITKEHDLARVFELIGNERKIDFVLHFAVYYDFYLQDGPIYQQVNIEGTRHVLKHAEKLKPKRFIFSSSLAVSEFLQSSRVINEQTPADADDPNPYVQTKKVAEKLVRQYAEKMPCTIVRMPAIFTDWCEQPPLYALLNKWLQNSWKSNIIVGRGTTAIPYLHVADLTRLLEAVIDSNSRLQPFCILIASPSDPVSHNDLYASCKHFTQRDDAHRWYCPLLLARIALKCSNLIGRLKGKRPFEQTWMLKYIDRQMVIDSSKTQEILGWKPRPCHHIRKRIFFMAKNRSKEPDTWLQKNEAWTKR